MIGMKPSVACFLWCSPAFRRPFAED